MRIALIHDYITSYGGAEKTFKVLTELFSSAKVFTLFYNSKIKNRFFPNIKIKTSFLQKFPSILRKRYQLLLPFLPVAAEVLDFREFDLVISSSFSFGKGIISRPKTIHICYCHTPTRYLWVPSPFQRSGVKRALWENPIAKILFHYSRIWDRQASERVDYFIANSKTTQERIKKYYKRTSTVIYPPVEMPRLRQGFDGQAKPKKEFYLIVSQLRKYKRIDLAVEAFNKLGLELIIIGDGPERKKLKKSAKKNVKILGWQPDMVVNKYYKNCTAFIFPGEDDFGIAPVEAMSWGKPVLAFRKGGATETVIEGKTGEFFDLQHSAILADGIRRLRENLPKYSSKFISNHVKKFSRKRFEKEFKKFIKRTLDLQK